MSGSLHSDYPARGSDPLRNVVYVREKVFDNLELYLGCTTATFQRRSDEAVVLLRGCAEQIDDSNQTFNLVKQGSGVASVAGGLLTIGGAFLSGPLAPVVTVGGVVVGAMGGAAGSRTPYAKSLSEEEQMQIAKIVSHRIVEKIQIFHKLLIRYDDALEKAWEYLETNDGIQFISQLETNDQTCKAIDNTNSIVGTIKKMFGGITSFLSHIKKNRGAKFGDYIFSHFPNAVADIGVGVWNIIDGFMTQGKCSLAAHKLKEFANEIADCAEALLTNYKKNQSRTFNASDDSYVYGEICGDFEPMGGDRRKIYGNMGCDRNPLPTTQHTCTSPQGENVYDKITYIMTHMSNKTKETVISELSYEVSLTTLQEWRESLFHEACRILGGDCEQFIESRLMGLGRRWTTPATRCAEAIVELAVYIAEAGGMVPEAGLCKGTEPGNHRGMVPEAGLCKGTEPGNHRGMVPEAGLCKGTEPGNHPEATQNGERDDEASCCCHKYSKMNGKFGQPSDNISLKTLWESTSVYELIIFIVYEMTMESKEAVIEYLIRDVPRETLQDWRGKIFQAACNTHEAIPKETDMPSGEHIRGLGLRQGATDAEDIVELVMYTSGNRETFPVDVLNTSTSRLCSMPRCESETEHPCDSQMVGKAGRADHSNDSQMVGKAGRADHSSDSQMVGKADSNEHPHDSQEVSKADSTADNLLHRQFLEVMDVCELISNLAYQLEIDKKADVLSSLANKTPPDILQKWREDLYEAAFGKYQAELEQILASDGGSIQALQPRGEYECACQYAEDVIELVLYISGSKDCFPYTVLTLSSVDPDTVRPTAPGAEHEVHDPDEPSEIPQMAANPTEQLSHNISPDTTEDDSHMIQHLLYHLQLSTKKDVACFIANDLPLKTILKWRENLFRQVIETYKIQLEGVGSPGSVTDTEFCLRTSGVVVTDYVDDIIKFVLYISGQLEVFPKECLVSNELNNLDK